MKRLLQSAALILVLGASAPALAKNGGFGFHLGTGLPYLSQAGLVYMMSGSKFSAELNYNAFAIKAGLAEISLTKPELRLNWHPFAGSFFVGLGVGQQTLAITAAEPTTGETAKVSVAGTALTPTIGWMWGVANGGFFAGLDFGQQMPSGATVKVESALPETNQAYIDVKEQGQKFGETGFAVFTLLRLGYVF